MPTPGGGLAERFAVACFGDEWEEELAWLRGAARGYPAGTVERYLTALWSVLKDSACV